MSHPATVPCNSVACDSATRNSLLQAATASISSSVQKDRVLKRPTRLSNTIHRLIGKWRTERSIPGRNHAAEVGCSVIPSVTANQVMNTGTGERAQPYVANDAPRQFSGASARGCDRSVLTRLEPILASSLVENCYSVDGALSVQDKKAELLSRMQTVSRWAAESESSELLHRLQDENLAIALNAARLLAGLASSDRPLLSTIGALPCIIEELVQLLKDERSKLANDVILEVLCALSTSLEENTLRCINSGGVAITTDLLSTETRKEVSEKALVLLELLISREEGRIAAGRHAATTISATGKKLLRVSDAATASAVRILWTILRYSSDDHHETLKQRALDCGIAGKLVLVLQVGCDYATMRIAGKVMRLLAEPRTEIAN